MRRRFDQECPDCGVIWHGPMSPDGLCGSNCRDTRAEIEAEVARQPPPVGHMPRGQSPAMAAIIREAAIAEQFVPIEELQAFADTMGIPW